MAAPPTPGAGRRWPDTPTASPPVITSSTPDRGHPSGIVEDAGHVAGCRGRVGVFHVLRSRSSHQKKEQDRPYFSLYCWWYSSARKNVEAGTTWVTIGRRNRPAAWSRAIEALAASRWPSSWVKITDRYWSPTSGPCRFRVVGSWVSQNTSSNCS